MEKEKQLLLLCRTLIEQSLNWGDSSVWGNDDFEQLSDKIFEKTRVQLSVSTLKRIWGKVRYENFPTAATLNALAGFLDYNSWRDFRQANQFNELPTISQPAAGAKPEAKPELVTKQSTSKKVSTKKIAVPFFAVVVILIAVGLIYISSKSKPKLVKTGSIKFEAIKATDNLPNSVIFNYDASSFQSNNVIIQQSWDPSRSEQVPGDGKQHTSIYYNPGYFAAKLIVDGQIKKELPIFIQTKGWLGIIEKAPIPTYLSPTDIKGRGYMGISDSVLQQKTGSPVFNDTWVNFANVREYKGIDAGNFSLKTTFRNASGMEASACRKIRLLILGTRAPIIITMADKGCISDIDLYDGEAYVSGLNHDLSAFGCDFSQFQHLECRVEQHRFQIFLNNKLIINNLQGKTIDKIVGIRFEVQGAAQIKNVKLSTPGGAVYNDEFE